KQFEAVSKDGTKIPYFVVMRKDAKMDGQNPTLLNAYGGFMISMKPRYSALKGTAWLEKGGVAVLANIRGGGEFGPKWHKAGLLKNRHKVFEDFTAVAEDLIKRKITSPEKLGIIGGSNGGLLVGTAFVARPDLYKAVVCQVPLLDMKRYHKLLAGASWAAEYGNPDEPGMWEYIKTYSPYQNVKKGVKYPKVFFTTSTRDDRVHPGHARKMVARMKNMGHEVFYYENIEGGHGGAANNKQRAYMNALSYAYLYKLLMGK
ncbi:MAG: S9 family peptidase, partial [bacterium]|nr:S9 family peptidase [bacterium]